MFRQRGAISRKSSRRKECLYYIRLSEDDSPVSQHLGVSYLSGIVYYCILLSAFVD